MRLKIGRILRAGLLWIDGVCNGLLGRAWVRAGIFRHFSALFLAMSGILGECRWQVVLILIGAGVAADFWRRNIVFLPSRSVASYLRYSRDRVWNRARERRRLRVLTWALVATMILPALFMVLMNNSVVIYDHYQLTYRSLDVHWSNFVIFMPKFFQPSFKWDYGDYARKVLDSIIEFYPVIVVWLLLSTFMADPLFRAARIRLRKTKPAKFLRGMVDLSTSMQDHKILALLISIALFITPGLVSVRNTSPGSRPYSDAITVQYSTDLFFGAALFYFMVFVTIVTINDARGQKERPNAVRDAGG